MYEKEDDGKEQEDRQKHLGEPLDEKCKHFPLGLVLRNYLNKVDALFPSAHPEGVLFLPPEADQALCQRGKAPSGLPP
jgi:hypothetical protein